MSNSCSGMNRTIKSSSSLHFGHTLDDCASGVGLWQTTHSNAVFLEGGPDPEGCCPEAEPDPEPEDVSDMMPAVARKFLTIEVRTKKI